MFDLPAGAEGVPGQIVRLALVERVAEAGFWVPASALTRGVRGLWAVYAVETDPSDGRTRAVRHHVEVLHAERERALVRGTIDASSRLIVGNTERIAPGQAVAPVGEGD